MNQIKGRCIDCKHYEYIDSKSRMSGGYNHWGYCHKEIPFEDRDDESLLDLSDYFQVYEDDYCSYFKEKDNFKEKDTKGY